MIKTLRITSVVAAILAGVLIKFFVLPMVTNVAGDPSVGKVLDSPGVIDRFKETKGAHAKATGAKTSPLVQQAIAYARILNPQPKVSTLRKGGRITTTKTILPPTTPKFKVFATTYFAGNPELSQALIDEPGKGRYWVRQSSMVGHLLIEQVKDGVVVVKNSEETFELEVEKSSKTSLTKGRPATSKATSSIGGYRRTSSISGKTAHTPTKASSVRTPAARTPSSAPKPSKPIASEKADELISRLKDLQRTARSDKTNSGLGGEERAARIEVLINKFKSPRASTGDAKAPTTRADSLKASGQDPNRISALPPSGKIQAGSAKSGVSTPK